MSAEFQALLDTTNATRAAIRQAVALHDQAVTALHATYRRAEGTDTQREAARGHLEEALLEPFSYVRTGDGKAIDTKGH